MSNWLKLCPKLGVYETRKGSSSGVARTDRGFRGYAPKLTGAKPHTPIKNSLKFSVVAFLLAPPEKV
jgi:hypothetical protein